MKLKGTINLIQKEDNSWIFKYTDEGVVKRVPFVYYSGVYQDGQEIDAYLETLAGIERAKPLFPLPYNSKVDEVKIEQTSSLVGEVIEQDNSVKSEPVKKVSKISTNDLVTERKLDK
jgi:hypothetical protein